MRLRGKLLLWFGGISIYVMVLGGVFYYNLFKWTFDEKLKQDVLELVRIKSPDLLKGLLRSPKAVTFDEFDVMEWLKSDKRITDIVYLNGNGTLRWHKLGQYIGMAFDEYEKTVGVPTDAIGQAYISGVPKYRSVPKHPYYEIAIPLTAKGDVVIGILCLTVSREGSDRIIRSAMGKYVIGAIGVFILLGVPLFLLLGYYVTSPISLLKDSIDVMTTKNLEIKTTSRNDEVGDLALAISGLLGKVRVELNTAQEKERERQTYEEGWWQAILNTTTQKDTKALVVDEDNSVLFANFELNRSASGQKLHLLDVIDSNQQEVLRLIGVAMDTPTQIVEGDCVFGGGASKIKVVQLNSQGVMRRTLIFFEPKHV